MKKKKLCLVTGGFDPVHSGHIQYLKESKKLADYLVVGLNSDDWLKRKKGCAFMPWDERNEILKNIIFVDDVIFFDDQDNSASDAILKCLDMSEKVIFANGGDRGKDNIPELDKFKDNDCVEFVFSVGGDNKKNSSSWIIENFINEYNNLNNNYNVLTIDAPWGGHDTIVDHKEYKLKQLFVKPNAKLSLQYHHHRSEHWVVASGTATVQLGENVSDLKSGEYIHIPVGEKHRISNNTISDSSNISPY